MKKLYVILTLLIALFLLNFVGLAEKDIRIGMNSDATTLDPRFITSTSGMYITGQIFNGLVKLTKDLEYVADLATFENTSDTTYVFYLKKGVKFHDGSELRAADVKFTYESILDPAMASPKAGNYKNIVGAEEFINGQTDQVAGIKIIDQYTISFELKEPFAPFLVNMNTGIVPKHIAEKEGKLDHNPVGTGPFKFKSRLVEQETILVANPDYFEGAPKLNRVIYKILPESSVGVVELQTGTIDVLMDITKEDIVIINGDPSLILASIAGTNYQYIGFNVTNSPVDNKYLRKAIAYALDKEAITKYFEGSRTYVPLAATSYLAKEYANDPKINKYQFSVGKAREMLDKSGYSGEEVVIKTSEGRKELAEIMKQMMDAVGIKTKIELLEWGTFYADVKQGRAQIYLLGWYGILDPDSYWFFHSEMTPPQGGANRMYYSNSAADYLIMKGRTTLDPEERKAVYAQLYQVLTDDVPMIFLYSKPDLSAYNKGIEGFEPAPYPVTILSNLKNAYWKR
ncbi:MAG: ABC transporter substrate-binding protein [Halanaerobiales bacterium]|nr:ABC transporter substrate-binding protein [Halanaerobiales bacterium]